jgi:small subunit ribosomal protein S4
LQLIESRLDNVVYRLGIAPTRMAARQLVGHRHITVNGKVVNIPSYTLRPGDIIAVRERSKSLEAIVNTVLSRSTKSSWLEFDKPTLTGKIHQRSGTRPDFRKYKRTPHCRVVLEIKIILHRQYSINHKL